MNGFIQTAPSFDHPFSKDDLLHEVLTRNLSPQEFKLVNEDFKKFENRLVNEIDSYAKDCIDHPPSLVPYTPWGEKLDHIKTAPGWSSLDRVSAEEGIVAIGYERKFQERSRFVQFMKLFLYHPSSAFYTCPLAMTDGAARLIEVFGDDPLKNKAFKNIISRDPSNFWTSGQWMTERSGGSDISNTETTATKTKDGYLLNGVKWFTSATTSQMAMTLARIVDEKGNSIAGSRGLSLFYLELRDDNQKLNGIEILRLKDKLGTKSLPTAELKLNNTKAKLVGEIGAGVKTIATLFNITRMYNATTTVGAWKRLLDLSINYSTKRMAFKKLLKDHPLHYQTLSSIRVQYEASFQLICHVSKLLGIEECSNDQALKDEASQVLRLLTPIAKLYTAKKHMQNCSELIESFGGAGYVEDTGLPMWLRDAQVLTIWEGTTNVLSLDVLRAMTKDNAFGPWLKSISTILKQINDDSLTENKIKTQELLKELSEQVMSLSKKSEDEMISIMRDLSFAIAEITCAALMLDHAQWSKNPNRYYSAKQFCSNLDISGVFKTRHANEDQRLLFGNI